MFEARKVNVSNIVEYYYGNGYVRAKWHNYRTLFIQTNGPEAIPKIENPDYLENTEKKTIEVII